jgi:hypothetical protein
MATFQVADGILYAEELTPGSLEDSLVKWEILHECASNGELVRDGGVRTCALCLMYHTGSCNCAGCPIREAIGAPYCQYAPYQRYTDAVKDGDAEGAYGASADMVTLLTMLFEEE